MKLSRSARLGGMALAGALALAACGSDNNSSTSSTSGAGGRLGASSTSAAALSGSLNGEGSTAQKNAIDQAIATFTQANPNAKVSYNATGSGAGIKQFNAGQVDFAGSDSALKTTPAAGASTSEQQDAQKRCMGNPAWNLPMVVGPISVAYNLSGVDKLVLTPDVIAKIFNGKITTWNDPAIAKINSGVTLPSTKISVFYRSDSSGTTENFQKYLKGAAPRPGLRPVEDLARQGRAGRGQVDRCRPGRKSTDGGVGYVEWSNAKDLKLGIAQVDNGGGAVELTADSAGKAISAATVSGTGNDLPLKLDYATKQPGRLPDRPRDLRDRVLEGARRGQDHAAEGLPRRDGQQRLPVQLRGHRLRHPPAEFATKVQASINAIS